MRSSNQGMIPESEREDFLAMLPSLDKNPKAALEVLDMMRTTALNWNERNRRQIGLYSQDKGANLHTDTSDITKPNSVMNSPKAQPGMLRVRLPDGRVGQMSENSFYKALKSGQDYRIAQ